MKKSVLVLFMLLSGAAHAQEKTGIAECDSFIETHRRCVAEKAPDQLPGVDTMAQELKFGALGWESDKTVEKQARTNCKQLREFTESQWDAWGCKHD